MRAAVLLLALALAGCGGGALERPGMLAEKIGAVPGSGACGIGNAYRVREAAGVRLSQPARLSRTAASRLDAWLRNRAVPIIGTRGGGLVGIRVAAHYACRTRNGRRGARLSEHARGNAIDISAFVLADGTWIVVEEGWHDGRDGRLLRRLHASACGPFGTVLGPDADRHHRDHFHFDVADYRSGAYCR